MTYTPTPSAFTLMVLRAVPAISPASSKRGRAIAKPGAPRSSAPGGELITLDQRVRDHAAQQFPAIRVLIAGGEKLVRAGLRGLLEEEGGNIAFAGEATSGREAVALASEIRPDVALVNVHRPDLDRFEATRRITQLLVVSPATAKTHVSRSMVKLHVRDRAKLVALAYQTGRSASR